MAASRSQFISDGRFLGDIGRTSGCGDQLSSSTPISRIQLTQPAGRRPCRTCGHRAGSRSCRDRPSARRINGAVQAEARHGQTVWFCRLTACACGAMAGGRPAAALESEQAGPAAKCDVHQPSSLESLTALQGTPAGRSGRPDDSSRCKAEIATERPDSEEFQVRGA